MKSLCAVLMLTALVACGGKKDTGSAMPEESRKDAYQAAQQVVRQELEGATVTFPDVVPATEPTGGADAVYVTRGDGGRSTVDGTFHVTRDGKTSEGKYTVTVQFQDNHYVGKPDPVADELQVDGKPVEWKVAAQ